ncbi:Uncharacterised protein [Bordetella pertussis]|nr:Uncharacterised protein [Bordetella pertussis]
MKAWLRSVRPAARDSQWDSGGRVLMRRTPCRGRAGAACRGRAA